MILAAVSELQCIAQCNFHSFIRNGNMIVHFYEKTTPVGCANSNQIAGVVSVLVILPITQQEELLVWYPSEDTRTRIRVIGVNFSEILIKGMEI